MRRSSGRILLALLIALSRSGALVLAQTGVDKVPEWQKAAGGKVLFDVASIKLANPAIPAQSTEN
ncbi:MAG TPA: hypothetical protein VGK48_17680 [Terriglobia bacterium]